MRYGVMGGTFDPIHLGHLFIAQEILEQLQLDRVIFMPNGAPPHKKARTSAIDRFSMVRNAINDNSCFEISDIEVFKEEYSYTVDTLKTLNDQNPGDEVFFIIGSDSVLSIQTWKSYREIFEMCKLVCFQRPGFNIEEMVIEKSLIDQIIFIDSILLEISSTDIRNRLVNGKSIKYMVNKETEKFIKENNLYRGEL